MTTMHTHQNESTNSTSIQSTHSTNDVENSYSTLQAKIKAAREYFNQRAERMTKDEQSDTESYADTESVTETLHTESDSEPEFNRHDCLGIADMVWQQTVKHYKDRLVHLEREISRLQSNKIDKLMLYTALQFLCINPDEKKINPHLIEWFDRHKYAWISKHDPQIEHTLSSDNWNEIGIPLTREPGSTPIHQDITVIEDIYDNVKRNDWIDPVSIDDNTCYLMDGD
eukprot:390502_1